MLKVQLHAALGALQPLDHDLGFERGGALTTVYYGTPPLWPMEPQGGGGPMQGVNTFPSLYAAG